MRIFPLLLSLALAITLPACSSEDDSATEIKKKKRGAKRVLLETVQTVDASTHHQRNGNLKFDRIVHIYSQEEGRVLELPFKEGDAVEQNEILVRLDDRLLSAELEKARATTHQARVSLDRIIDLDKRQVASQDEVTRARTALEVATAEQKVLTTRIGFTHIPAPFSGVITERKIEPGDVVSRHSHLLTLADPNSLITEVSVSELLLSQLSKGQDVSITIDALGGKSYPGKLVRIYPALDHNTHHGKIEIALDPVPENARAGQFVRVSLKTRTQPRLLIPFSALRRDPEGEYVFLFRDGKAIRQAVRSGIRVDDHIEILDGLQDQQQIVTRGFLGLKSGREVKVPEHIADG
ncbi:MAG: efflux RND transporter periplasmic adaptor subunit [bacterium]